MSTGKEFEVTEVGAQTPQMTQLDSLRAGDVGYIAAAIKDVRDIRIGDTITDAKILQISLFPVLDRQNLWSMQGSTQQVQLCLRI